jgi:ribosomal protein L12E/L44/L45/RPP1/RPP2
LTNSGLNAARLLLWKALHHDVVAAILDRPSPNKEEEEGEGEEEEEKEEEKEEEEEEEESIYFFLQKVA